jgi:hypothetical protein
MNKEGESSTPPTQLTNTLLSRLYTDEKSRQSTNSLRAKAKPLSTSRSTPLLRKPNPLITEYKNRSNESSAIGGHVQATLDMSPSKIAAKKAMQTSAAFNSSTSLESTTALNAMPTKTSVTFLDSLNLSAKDNFNLFHIPQYFIYLQMKPEEHCTNSVPRSVYDLEVVRQDKVDKFEYFTISKEGITQFLKDSSHFTPLEQWEREFKIFNKISSINFFTLYKRWKVYMINICII